MKDVSTAVAALTIGQKYALIPKHVPPPAAMPTRCSYGCNHKFNTDWLKKFPWLAYSPSVDGVFCAPCSVLLSEEARSGKGTLVNSPFTNWVKISDVLTTHAGNKYHQNAMQDADTLHTSVDNPGSRLDVMVSSTVLERIATIMWLLRILCCTI